MAEWMMVGHSAWPSNCLKTCSSDLKRSIAIPAAPTGLLLVPRPQRRSNGT